MMSNICLKSEKSGCSIGCFVGSTVKSSGQASLQYTFLEKRAFLGEFYFKVEWQKVTKASDSKNGRATEIINTVEHEKATMKMHCLLWI